MIELTSLNGNHFILNSGLIEIITKIPETKITLTNEKYYLVKESVEDVLALIVEYKRGIYQSSVLLKNVMKDNKKKQ
ncbi:MAG: flagellar FlbD family protein [Oscillospiraceae bacterium]